MLHLAKFAGIAVLIWFYLSAKDKEGASPINWAITGVIGYWITWWAVKLTVVNAFSGVVAKSATGTFLLLQIPALCAIGAAFLIRKKLVADIAEND